MPDALLSLPLHLTDARDHGRPIRIRYEEVPIDDNRKSIGWVFQSFRRTDKPYDIIVVIPLFQLTIREFRCCGLGGAPSPRGSPSKLKARYLSTAASRFGSPSTPDPALHSFSDYSPCVTFLTFPRLPYPSKAIVNPPPYQVSTRSSRVFDLFLSAPTSIGCKRVSTKALIGLLFVL